MHITIDLKDIRRENSYPVAGTKRRLEVLRRNGHVTVESSEHSVHYVRGWLKLNDIDYDDVKIYTRPIEVETPKIVRRKKNVSKKSKSKRVAKRTRF